MPSLLESTQYGPPTPKKAWMPEPPIWTAETVGVAGVVPAVVAPKVSPVCTEKVPLR